jgi:hypothetical protein
VTDQPLRDREDAEPTDERAEDRTAPEAGETGDSDGGETETDE